jgi:hypothetical protein
MADIGKHQNIMQPTQEYSNKSTVKDMIAKIKINKTRHLKNSIKILTGR